MKRKAIIAILAAVVVALSAFSVLALDLFGTENTTSETMRFFVLEANEAGDEFSMVSENGELVIHITGNTPVNFEYALPISDECDGVTSNVRELLFGQTLAEVLEGRNMRVLFEEGEHVEPISITVLFETFSTGPALLDPEDLYPEDGYMGFVTLPGDISGEEFDLIELNGEVVVNNEILEGAPLPFWAGTETGSVVMVPLNVVAQALGYDVYWNDELQSIQLGVGVQIWIGNTEAHLGRMAPIELSAAPVLMGDDVFVPLDFFRDVLGQTAYVFEGQVVIETYSDMM